jgi:hypothetical protein
VGETMIGCPLCGYDEVPGLSSATDDDNDGGQ